MYRQYKKAINIKLISHSLTKMKKMFLLSNPLNIRLSYDKKSLTKIDNNQISIFLRICSITDTVNPLPNILYAWVLLTGIW